MVCATVSMCVAFLVLFVQLLVQPLRTLIGVSLCGLGVWGEFPVCVVAPFAEKRLNAGSLRLSFGGTLARTEFSLRRQH